MKNLSISEHKFCCFIDKNLLHFAGLLNCTLLGPQSRFGWFQNFFESDAQFEIEILCLYAKQTAAAENL